MTATPVCAWWSIICAILFFILQKTKKAHQKFSVEPDALHVDQAHFVETGKAHCIQSEHLILLVTFATFASEVMYWGNCWLSHWFIKRLLMSLISFSVVYLGLSEKKWALWFVCLVVISWRYISFASCSVLSFVDAGFMLIFIFLLLCLLRYVCQSRCMYVRGRMLELWVDFGGPVVSDENGTTLWWWTWVAMLVNHKKVYSCLYFLHHPSVLSSQLWLLLLLQSTLQKNTTSSFAESLLHVAMK